MAKKKRPIPSVLHGPIYGVIRAAITVLGAAPPAEALRWARSAARLFARAPFNRKRLSRAIENLAVARPLWSPEQREEYAVRAYEHIFMLAVEMASAERLITSDGWPPRVDVNHLGPELAALLKTASAAEPCVFVTGHCGNFELLGYGVAQLGFPIHALYRPFDLKPLDRWIRRTREAHGLMLLDKFGAGDDLPRIMASGGMPGFVADQNAGDKGLFVPFFGRLASSYKSVGLLALHQRARVVCGVARRVSVPYECWDEQGRSIPPALDQRIAAAEAKPQSLRYRLDVVDVIEPEDWEKLPDPLFYITARYRRAIEQMVARAPEQFFWMHRYWKSRPRHEHQGKPFPAALRAKLEALPWMTPGELERIMEHSRRDAATLKAAG